MEVRAEASRYQDLQVEDTAQISCRLNNGACGVINLSWSMPLSANTYFEVYGEEGALLLDFNGLNYKFKTWNEWKRIFNKATVKEAFNRQLDHFIEAITTKAPLVTNNDDGLKAQELIQMSYDSIKNGF